MLNALSAYKQAKYIAPAAAIIANVPQDVLNQLGANAIISVKNSVISIADANGFIRHVLASAFSPTFVRK